MHNLLELQEQFQKNLLDNNQTFLPRFAIYIDAYQARLVKALNTHYPVLAAYLGTELFNKLAIDYLKEHPSSQPSIRWFGDKLPHFLTIHEEYKNFPYFSELADFEWKHTLVFDAKNSDTMRIEDIKKIPLTTWAEMRLTLHPSVQRICFSWNIVEIWQAIINGLTPDVPIKTTTPVNWILWRRDLINHFDQLTPHEAYAIDLIIQGVTFGELCEQACEWVGEEKAGIYAASLLKKWIQSGLITKVI